MLRGPKFKTRKNRGEIFVDEIHPEKKKKSEGKRRGNWLVSYMSQCRRLDLMWLSLILFYHRTSPINILSSDFSAS